MPTTEAPESVPQAILMAAKSIGVKLDIEAESGRNALIGPDKLDFLRTMILVKAAIEAAEDTGEDLRFDLSAYDLPSHLKEDVVSFFLSYIAYDDLLVEEADGGAYIVNEGVSLSPEATLALLEDLRGCIFSGDLHLTIYLKPSG